MKREDIIAEYYKAEIHYKAMAALLKAENITLDGTTPSAEPVQPVTEPEQPKPASTKPEIVYTGNPTISLSAGEHTTFKVYIYNVASSSDYVISPAGDPTFAKFAISGQKISNGFCIDFDVKAKLPGKASVSIRIKNDPSNNLNIVFNIS